MWRLLFICKRPKYKGMAENQLKEQQDDEIAEIGISDSQISTIVDAIDEGDKKAVNLALDSLDAVDTAVLLEKIGAEGRQALLENHSHQFDGDVFVEIDSDLRKKILESLSPKKVADYISELDSDDALDLLQNLDPIFQKDVLKKLSGRDREAIEEGLNFPEESAGRLMQREFVAIPEFWTVGKTIDYLREAAEDIPEDFSDIFVITPTYHVAGEIPLNRILRSQRSKKIAELVLDKITTIPASMDQEDVARIFKREGYASAPVIDDNERLIGVITIDDIIHVVHEEAEEDILRMGGLEKTDLYSAVLETAQARFSWLAINLITAIAASIVIGFFEATIAQIVALAILLPIVASMGGNAGTQTLTVTVRALATKAISSSNALRMIGKEIIVGLINGIIFAVIMGGIVWVWFGSPLLGGVIAAAMIINMITAGLFGICIPLALERLKIDPALASTVFLTTMTDVIGFFAFLGLAAWLLV
ncbi:MAG: magnesium transporter [Micavibrio sp.]|nr:magnesium transporter [Micavibrio sp.]